MGLILCADKGQQLIELLELEASGIHVAEYLTELPPRELIERKLLDAIRIARESPGARLMEAGTGEESD